MFNDIVCSDPAYERIVKSGLLEKIKEKSWLINHALLYNQTYFEDDSGWDSAERQMLGETRGLVEWCDGVIGNPNRTFREATDALDILELEEELSESGPLSDHLFVEHPTYLARLILGDDIEKFRDFGFSSERNLSEAVSSFCVSEMRNSYGHEYTWRNNGIKNVVSLNEHGDMYVGQRDVSVEESSERDLYGDCVGFESFVRDSPIKCVQAYQDWSGFLISLLKYAEHIGKENIPEIREWKNALQRVGGGVGTNTAEAMFGAGGFDDSGFLLGMDLLEQGREGEGLPLVISLRERFQIPYLMGNRLGFLYDDEGGEIEMRNKKYSVGVVYDERDLPHALVATYRFFARDKTLMYRIMDGFLGSS